MQKEETSTLQLPVKISYLPAAQAYLTELMQSVGFKQKDVTLLMIAAEEAITNVIKHAFLPDEEMTFEIVTQLSPVEFRIIIRDKGLPFDPEQIGQYSPEEELSGASSGGLGFRLMKGSVDQFSFHNKGYGGKEAHLVKFRQQKHIDSYVDTAQLESYEQPVHQAPQERVKIPYHTQLLEIKQAIEISQCAYRTYGYTYIMENIYFPERLVEMNKSGDLISAVAVTEETGEMMSHVALELFGKKRQTPELGMALTKPQFRGQGCMTFLNQLLIDQAKKRNIRGIFAKGVSTHPYSQKALLRSGFKDCAILIGLSAPKVFEKMEVQSNQRETLVLSYMKLLEAEPIVIYAPTHHLQMITEIYRNIELEVRILEATGNAVPQIELLQSDIEVEVSAALGYANIYVNAIGKNFQNEINQRLKELLHKKVEVINLYLDLCDPAAGQQSSVCETLNFFFAGIFPSGSRQYLILQYLNYVSIDYGKIVIESEFAQKLMRYITALNPSTKETTL
ncbi:MAG: ATP-binding protein [Candidatus Marinimicrobia bacterium]|jgi:serine/threonine-protein kinase RsbW|nr:ATP-binding protein [Candidatus Neomarinimicrobiota bacterium]MDD5541200.1 ATP-binding protein [Candidatus Neomarinimicrobiota bacterium]